MLDNIENFEQNYDENDYNYDNEKEQSQKHIGQENHADYIFYFTPLLKLEVVTRKVSF